MRYSSNDGPPPCWARFRDDAECQECAWRARCRRAVVAERRPTVAECIVQVKQDARQAAGSDPDDLFDFTKRALSIKGGRFRRPTAADPQELVLRRVMSTIAAACEASGVNPRDYLQAQVDTMGQWYIDKGLPMTPGSLVGPKADERYQRWLARTKRVSVAKLADRGARLRAANVFASEYFRTGDLDVAEVAADGVLAGWRPDMMTPLDRLAALSHALSERDPSLPDRVCPPADWTWEEARRFLDQVTVPDEVPDEAPLELSSDLGEIL